MAFSGGRKVSVIVTSAGASQMSSFFIVNLDGRAGVCNGEINRPREEIKLVGFPPPEISCWQNLSGCQRSTTAVLVEEAKGMFPKA